MSAMFVFSVCMSIVIVMPLMMQPLSLGLCVMVLSVFSCVCIGFCVSSWYGYVLFLVYVGGLLVMFAYVSALAPNNFFSSTKALVGFVCSVVLCLSWGFWSYIIDDVGIVLFNGDVGKVKYVGECGYMLVVPSGVSVMVVLGVILLINLLAVVKICYYQQGPLRPHSELK
uniref:NADH-ubiquinone oxidoreductase chain 6 n=1 Tax=Calliotropis micraulax TaxID=2496602 RepID=A0A6B7FQM4_9VEST|nr:NADH dehydrogenase subunit 6 [Calliotropis micraulax]